MCVKLGLIGCGPEAVDTPSSVVLTQDEFALSFARDGQYDHFAFYIVISIQRDVFLEVHDYRHVFPVWFRAKRTGFYFFGKKTMMSTNKTEARIVLC